jgi:hypothetical protein
MTIIQLIATLVSAIIIPYIVQLIKTHAMSASVARILGIGVSLLAGVFTGFISGIPDTPAAWLTCVFAVIGGVQVAYAAFKAVGVTSKWLDALENIGSHEPTD